MGTLRSLFLVAALGCSNSNGPSSASKSAGVPAPGSSPAPQGFREGIDLAESQSALENGQLQQRFDFSRQRELWVRMRVAGVGGTTVVRLTLTTPTGSTFYESTIAYSPDPGQNTMMVPNAPHPITVFPAQPVYGGHALVYVVPVAGTALSRYPVPGRWHVDATFESGRVISTEIDVTYSR